MNISQDLENINNFIKYLSMVSKSITDKMEGSGQATITIQEYNIVKNLSKIVTEYFNSEDEVDVDVDDVAFLDDESSKPKEISDNFILKIKNNELSKEQLLCHNTDLEKKYIIFNLNCYLNS
jgi:hypothetical protein